MLNSSCTMLKHIVSLWRQHHHFLLLREWLPTVTICIYAEPLYPLIMTQFIIRVFVQSVISQGHYCKVQLLIEWTEILKLGFQSVEMHLYVLYAFICIMIMSLRLLKVGTLARSTVRNVTTCNFEGYCLYKFIFHQDHYFNWLRTYLNLHKYFPALRLVWWCLFLYPIGLYWCIHKILADIATCTVWWK